MNNLFSARDVHVTLLVRQTLRTVAVACGVFVWLGGQAFCRDSIQVPFEGRIDFGRRHIVLNLLPDEDRSFILTAWAGEEGLTHLTLNLRNQQAFIGKISTLLAGQFRTRSESARAGPSIAGTLRSRYTLINGKPVQDIEASLLLTKERLVLRSLTTEDIFLKGHIQVDAPHEIDLELLIRGLDVDPFLEAVAGDEMRTSFGPFEGRLRLTGAVDRLALEGRLLTSNGIIDGIDYQDMLLNVEGIYPLVHIDHSHIIQLDGTIFKITGDLDLRRMAAFDRQVRRFISKPLIQRDGQDLEWTLKRLHQDGSNAISELKYLYRKNDNDRSTSREDGVIFGLERQHKF